jgi:hypothetical protein
MSETEHCVRCSYAGPSWDFSYWVLVCDDSGDRLAGVCDRCLTATERREIDQEARASLDDDFAWLEAEPPAANAAPAVADEPPFDTGQWFLRDLRLTAASDDADRSRRPDRR